MGLTNGFFSTERPRTGDLVRAVVADGALEDCTTVLAAEGAREAFEDCTTVSANVATEAARDLLLVRAVDGARELCTTVSARVEAALGAREVRRDCTTVSAKVEATEGAREGLRLEASFFSFSSR